MTKIVVNVNYGGFSLSTAACTALLRRKVERGEKLIDNDNRELTEEDVQYGMRDVRRDDPDLVAVVEEMGKTANGRYAALGIVEVPDDVAWCIAEYDGSEWVAEKHRVWYGERG